MFFGLSGGQFALVIVILLVSIFHSPLFRVVAVIMQALKHLLGRKSYANSNTQWNPQMGSFYSLNARDIDGKDQSFSQYAGSVSLVTNVACF